MKKVLASFILFVAVAGCGLVFQGQPVLAQSSADVCQGVGAAGGSCGSSGTGTTVNDVITVVINLLSTVVGITAVIMLIIGGFKYITSSGDSSNVQSAKNTIMFALVGLVIVALAQVIVVFVLDKATPNPPSEAVPSGLFN